MAQTLLDRFFREGEGKTNRQIDVYFTLEDMRIPRDKAEEGLEYLISRGLINSFGPDIAFLTEIGVEAITDEKDISKLPKHARDFGSQLPDDNASASNPIVAERPTSGTPRLPPHPAQPMLRFTDGSMVERTINLGMSCTIGRVEGNTLHLDDQRASKRHAEVLWDGTRFVVKDLGAANGTVVNGEYIETHPLKHGDSILIGRTTLVYEAPKVVQAPPPEEEEVPTISPDLMAAALAADAAAAEAKVPAKVAKQAIAPTEDLPSSTSGRKPSRGARPHRDAPPTDPVRVRVPPEPGFPRDEPTNRDAKSASLLEAEDVIAPLSQALVGEQDNDAMSVEHRTPLPRKNSTQISPAPDPALMETIVNADVVELAERDTGLDEEPWAGSDARTPQDPMALLNQDAGEAPTGDISHQMRKATIRAPSTLDAALEADTTVFKHDPKSLTQDPKATLVEGPGPALPRAMSAPPYAKDVSWADSAVPHSADAGGPKDPEGEVLPDAPVSLADLSVSGMPALTGDTKAPKRRDSAPEPRIDSEFHRTLRQLRAQVEGADVPDRDRLVSAIEVLEHHPYVRTALNLAASK